MPEYKELCDTCKERLLEIKIVNVLTGREMCMKCYGNSEIPFRHVDVYWRFLHRDPKPEWIFLTSGKEKKS